MKLVDIGSVSHRLQLLPAKSRKITGGKWQCPDLCCRKLRKILLYVSKRTLFETKNKMMETLKDYEKKVVSLLISDVFSPDELNNIINDSEFVGLDKNGGSGYFLEVSNSSLPEERIVCFEPQIIGEADGIICGFVILLKTAH